MAAARRIEIQWLRALAATEVAIVHSDLLTKYFTDYRLVGEWWYQPIGGVGVELFFILSGYVICMRAPFHASAGAFMRSRVMRLFPLYWVFTSIVLLTYFINPTWRLNNFHLDLNTIAQSYLILPQWNFPILGVGWTLEHEMVFYWLVTLVMLRWSMAGSARFVIAWLLVAMGFIGCLQGPAPGYGLWPFHIFSPYMFAFGFGWLLCCLEDMDRQMRLGNLAFIGIIAGFAYFFGTSFGGRLVLRIAFAAVVFYGFIAFRREFTAENRLNRLVLKVGDASFSIYLSHWFVLSALGKLLSLLQPPAYTSGLIRGIGVAISIAVGMWLYEMLEKPLGVWLRRGASVRDLLRPRLQP